MNKDKMILQDGTTIELEACAGLGALQVASADRATMADTWGKLTPENLADVKIQNGTGLTVGTYKDLMLISETSIVETDGSVSTTYALREKSIDEKRLDALEAGQAVQDGAIEDLGKATSDLAEQIGGVE